MFWEQCFDWCISRAASASLRGGPEWSIADQDICILTCQTNLTVALYAGAVLIALGVVIYIAVRLAIKHSTGTGA